MEAEEEEARRCVVPDGRGRGRGHVAAVWSAQSITEESAAPGATLETEHATPMSNGPAASGSRLNE